MPILIVALKSFQAGLWLQCLITWFLDKGGARNILYITIPSLSVLISTKVWEAFFFFFFFFFFFLFGFSILLSFSQGRDWIQATPVTWTTTIEFRNALYHGGNSWEAFLILSQGAKKAHSKLRQEFPGLAIPRATSPLVLLTAAKCLWTTCLTCLSRAGTWWPLVASSHI